MSRGLRENQKIVTDASGQQMSRGLRDSREIVTDASGQQMSRGLRNSQKIVTDASGQQMSRSLRNSRKIVTDASGQQMSRGLRDSREIITGPGGQQMTRNQTPAHKTSSRKSQAKQAAKALAFKPLTEPHVKTLLEKKASVDSFVDKNPTFKKLVTGPLEGTSALDSASGTSPWKPRNTDAGKRAGASRDGGDLYRFAIYNEAEEMWMEGWRVPPVDESGKRIKSVDKRSDCEVFWCIYTWCKGKWVPPGSDEERTKGEKLAEVDAQDRFVEFVGNTTILEYNNCDHLRINSWLGINGKGGLKWFDMCCGVCMSLSDNIQALFGPKKKAISPSVNAKLETISTDMFVVGGPSNAFPKEDTAAHTAKLFPHLVEIQPDHCEYSDDTLDVQTLFNLFVVVRQIYRIGRSSSSSSSSSSRVESTNGSGSDASGSGSNSDSDSATKAADMKKKGGPKKRERGGEGGGDGRSGGEKQAKKPAPKKKADEWDSQEESEEESEEEFDDMFDDMFDEDGDY
ncbi:hypothetical protein TrRE_jg3791 [Triparma retinervis]|uniref:Uncharacterized protein n=1 Tax=Triparma retinervis TaxID=2557542 RepID=A0A9W6ZZ29_9STRA|nr:hypothetical protein TrRE_jg3791 [Triparma retinervis]